jgi:hypothetical protein
VTRTALILSTRTSNALDFALLVQELVPLLEVYEHAYQTHDDARRFELADAICQGISPDPELFVNRVELLAAYSMIEHLFITTDTEGHAVHTPMGQRHVQLLQEYEARIGRVSTALSEDCPRFRPLQGTYSPYGVLYGFTTNLMEHMAFKTLQPDAVTQFSLEDVFAGGDSEKLAWVNGWRKLPHPRPNVAALFDYPQQFAEDAFNRVEHALKARVSRDAVNTGVLTGRLFVSRADNPRAESETSLIPDLPVRYLQSSDSELVTAHKADARDETELLSDRREGKFLVSYKTTGGWSAIAKGMLSEVLGEGRDAKVVGLPAVAEGALTLMYPDLVIAAEANSQSLRPEDDGQQRAQPRLTQE